MIFKWFNAERGSAVERFAQRDRLNPLELLPWVLAIAAYYIFPSYLPLGSQILLTILFAISLDLALGYAGIITLGHAAFFGVGAYSAGLYAMHVTGEPLSGLVVAAVAAGILGFLSGLVILRTTGLTLIMLTLAVLLIVQEFANRARPITGGADGLNGIAMKPIFGTFRFDLFGHTAYWYCLIVLFVMWIFTLFLVRSPFGRSLTGVRENITRMHHGRRCRCFACPDQPVRRVGDTRLRTLGRNRHHAGAGRHRAHLWRRRWRCHLHDRPG
ncbi:MAG: branched-chain amino acid transporter permease [Rhodospirillales bacterium]|nr:branched-chain amino acid transporter permease [Rhodospirillales bacterium]